MLTVLNAFLLSSATVIVPSGCLFWLKPVAMVLFMLCSAVRVEWLLLKTCGVEICGMLFVMYGRNVFYSVLLSLREVRCVCMMFLVSMCEGLCCCLVIRCTCW